MRYRAILADPPWSFKNWSPRGTGRNASAHYDCLSYKDLAAMPVGDLAADDCALFLWVTDPMLPRGLDLIRAWGFEYSTVAFYWAKLNPRANSETDFFMGTGYWTRANPEQCLLATLGGPKRQAADVRKLVVEKRREHSRKPDRIRDDIERLVDGPYLEMFARETRPGWDSMGDQVGLFDDGPVQTRRRPSRIVDQPRLPLAATQDRE